MATVESKPAAASTNGASGIPVENPATGEVITTVPAMSAEEVKSLAARGRKAQPEWEAMGFDGRAKVLRRAQKWVIDNSDRIIDVISSETGKTYEDAQLAEVSYAANAFGFWAKHAPEYLADERVKSSQLFVKGTKLIVRYQPLGLVGVIGPWKLPVDELVRRLHPGARGRELRDPQALGDHAADLDADGRHVARVRPAGRRLPGCHRLRRNRQRAGGRGRLHHVHRLDEDRQEGGRTRGTDAHARRAGARGQGPDDRVGRRGSRARRERRVLLRDAERRPDLHLRRTRLRGGAGVRRVRGQGAREGRRACARAARRGAPARSTSAR